MTAANAGGNTFAGTLYETRGPAFNAVPFDPGAVTLRAVGHGNAHVPRRRFRRVRLCRQRRRRRPRSSRGRYLRARFRSARSARCRIWRSATNYQDLWWNAPGGFGIRLGHQPHAPGQHHLRDVVHLRPRTARRSGFRRRWPRRPARRYAGTLYRTTGPAFNATPFDPAKVALTAVGAAGLTFADGNRATFSYTVNGIAQSKAITRQVFRAPGTTCR